MQLNTEDPLGILGKSDPLGILKKKDGGVTPPAGPSPAALLRLEELKKQLNANQLKPQRTELPREAKQAQVRAESIKTKEEVTPKVTPVMFSKTPTFKVEYPEQDELTAKVLGFQSAQQRVQFQEEDQQKKQENTQKAADEFYNTGAGKLYYNFFQPLAESGARAIGNTGATLSRLAGEENLANAIVDRFNPEKRYEGTIAGNKPTKLQGGLFNDGKANYSKLPSSFVRGLTDMAWLIVPAGGVSKVGQAAGLTQKAATSTGLIANSFLQSREDYYQEGKASGLKGDALDNFATGAAGLTSALEAVFPNTIAMGGFKSKMVKEYAKQIASGITAKAALKAGAKEVLKEAFVKEPIQEVTQLVGDKVARTLTDMATGENNFGDQFDWDKSKDEIYETLVMTPVISLFAAGSGAIRNYAPTNYEKALFYDASKNAQKVNQLLDNKFIQNEITEDQYKQAKQKFASYNTALEQVKNLGYSEDQTLQMAWELFSGKEKLPVNQSVIADPILKDALGDEIKKDKETISENIKSIGMGIPSIGSDIDGKELSFVISNIGDKGAEIGQGLVDQIGDDTYRVEEVSVKDIYDNNPEFRSYVESYKKGSIDADAMLVPAILKDNNIVDGRARLAEQYLSGKDRVKIFKNISNAINQSEVEVAGTEGDISQPQGIVQGQPEVGQGEGQQGQTQITQPNVSDSNIGGQGQVVSPELSNIGSITTDKRETIKQKFDFIKDEDFVEEAFTPDEDKRDRDALPESGIASEQELSDLLANGEYAMLTGQNPDAVAVSKSANKTLNERAVQWLTERGLKAIPIFGKYGNSERSFLVPNMTKDQATEFANQFQQDSVAHSSGLLYKDGSYNPRLDGVSLEPRFDQGGDFFSSINIAGKPVDFSINYDFEQTVPAEGMNISPVGIAEELRQDLVRDPIEKAAQSLKSTGVSIELVEDPAEYDAMVEQLGGQRGTEGVFLSNEGKILLNKSKLNDAITAGRIVWHESSHPVINIIRNTNPELYNRVISGMKSSNNPAVQQAIAWANQNYQGEGVIDDESIVEAIAMVADGTLNLNQIPTGLKQSIIDFINLIARAFNLGQVRDTDVQEFKNIVGQIADALTSGRDIAQVVGQKNIKEYMNKLNAPELVGGGEINLQPRIGDGIDVYKSKEIEDLDRRSLEEVYNTYGGRAVVINSDPTSVGELTLPSGKKIFMYGGPAYLSIKDNVDSNVGFATTQIGKVNTWMKYVNDVFGDNTGVTLVATQAPTSILSNSYALRYVMDGISMLPKSVLRSSEFKNEFFGKDLVLLKDAFGEKAYNEFVAKYKKSDLSNPEVIDGMISEMAYKVGDDNKPASFKARGAFVANLLGGIKQKAKLKTVEGDQGYVSKKPTKYISGQLFNRLGINTEKVIREIGVPSLVELYMNEGKWGMAVSGFETNSNMSVESVQSGGVKHPLFNAKFPGSNPFILDGAYEINKMFKPIEMTGPKGGAYTKTAAQMLAGSMYVKGQPLGTEGSFEYTAVPASAAAIQQSVGKRNLIENAGLDKQMSSDGKGNYVFFHYSGKKLSKIDPSKFGANLATGRDERPGVGLSMYYVDNKTLESGVPSDFGYAVSIPKDKVYPFNEDPLNLYDQAKTEFEKDYPGQAFDANKQIGYITKVANDNGFDITVANWNIKGRKALRAQTTKSLKPEVYKQKVFKNGSERDQFNEELQKLKPGVQASVGNRPENNANFKLGAFVMRKKAEGATDGEIAIAIASVTGMKPEDIKTLIDNPEQYIRDKFPSMSKLQQDNLIEKAKIQNIYRGRQFGKPIDKAFTGLEVPKEKIDEYMRKTAGADNFVKQWASDFQKNWLDPAKGLPSWVLAIKDFASGTKNIEISRAVKTIERLKAEAKKIGFEDWNAFSKALVVAKDVKRFIPNEDGIVPFDAGVAAAGRMFTTPDDQLPAIVPEEIKALPEEIIPYVYAMRGQIDNLTRDLIGYGYVTPEQAVTLENNLGQYVNRSYKMYNEMKYKPEKETYNAAVKFLADQYIKQIATDKAGVVTYEEVQNEAIEKAKKDVEAILNKKKNPYFNASTDRRNTGILEERKDIPEPIRKLMGEYTDPGTVFMMTVAKQAALKASSEYLNKLRENGMGTLFFEDNDPSRPASHSVQIASTGTESMSPLGGLFTTPEIAEALETVEPTYNELTNTWMKLVGAVRWGKTVGSIATQLKNFESNLGFAVLNGMLLSGKNTKAFGAAGKYVKGQYSAKEIDAITEKAIKLNLVGQSVGMRELKSMLGSGDISDIALDISLSPDGKWGKKVASKLNVFSAANKLYRLGDDFWKVYAYINEREQLSDARFGQAYDQLTTEQQEQIDVESSERVKSTWPTYDRVVEAAKFVSKRAPIFGNFISFQAESLRVLANSIKIAKEDLKDPKTAHLGVRRIAGITAYFGLRSAITIGLAKLTGFAAAGILGAAFGDDEEERNKKAIKEALPPFMRTGDLFVKRTKEPHKFVVVNMSSLDPYAIIPNSLNAYTEGREGIFKKTMDPGVGAATAELFSAFLEPEMTFQTMWSVVNNIDPKTKQDIVLSTDTDGQAFAKVSGKVWDQLEPSSVALVKRLMERKDKEAELLAIGGARPYDVDLHKSFGYILSQFGRDVDAINREYNGIKYKEVPQEDKDAAEKAAEDKKAFAISKVNEIYRNFINLGADPKVLDDIINQRSSIKVTGFDKNTKKYLKTGDIKREKLFK
jgi:hypothetical protein